MTSAATGNDALAEQAAYWLVQLGSDDDAERHAAEAGFATWKAADPRHAQAAAEIEILLEHLQAIRGPQARPARVALGAVFAQPRRQRRNRQIAAALAIAVLLGGPAALTLESHAPRYFTADLRTGTGEWHRYTLQDGSTVALDSGSAINLRFEQGRRVVELVQGGILVTVARDASRPFVVQTPQGDMRALGTRFTVERSEGSTTLSMLESKVAVLAAAQRAAGAAQASVVQAGERVRITGNAVGAVERIDPAGIDYAWQHRKMAVEDRPLTEVLAQLDRYRSGHLTYDAAQLAGIRVSAVLPLDDTDGALQLLLNNFPQLRIRRFTPYWVVVDAPPQADAKK